MCGEWKYAKKSYGFVINDSFKGPDSIHGATGPFFRNFPVKFSCDPVAYHNQSFRQSPGDVTRHFGDDPNE